MRIQFRTQSDAGEFFYREQLDCRWTLTPLPVSSRIDLASLIGHALEPYAYAAII